MPDLFSGFPDSGMNEYRNERRRGRASAILMHFIHSERALVPAHIRHFGVTAIPVALQSGGNK